VIIGKKGPLSLSLAVGVAAFVALLSQSSGASVSLSHSSARTTVGATYVALGDSYSSGEGLPVLDPMNGSIPREYLLRKWMAVIDRRIPFRYWSRRPRGIPRALVLSHVREWQPDRRMTFRRSPRAAPSSQERTGAFSTRRAFSYPNQDRFADDRGKRPRLLQSVGRVRRSNGPAWSAPLRRAVSGPERFAGQMHVHSCPRQECRDVEPRSEPVARRFLIDTYTKILNAAPAATLFVVTYPQLLTTNPVTNFCPLTRALHVNDISFYLGIDPVQVTKFNALESDLNSDIAQAAQQVNQTLGTNRIAIVNVNALTTDQGQSCNTATMSHSIVNGVLFAPGESLVKIYDDCIHGTNSLVARCTKSISVVKNDFIAKRLIAPKEGRATHHGPRRHCGDSRVNGPRRSGCPDADRIALDRESVPIPWAPRVLARRLTECPRK